MTISTVVSSRLVVVLFPILILATDQTIAQQYICGYDKGNYTNNSTYEANLNHLLSTLPSQNGNGYGFYNLSYGSASDQVYVIGLCKGDVSSDICRSCLNDSTHVLKKGCPYQMEAILWYDKCTLRYSNRSLMGVMETSPKIYMWNTENVSSNIADEYFKNLGTLFADLKSQAASGGPRRKFATGNVTVPSGYKTIYQLVQCTPDLSEIDCNNCLDSAFGNILGCCHRTKGFHILIPSCTFRYEDYLFYNSTPDEPPIASTPPPSLTNNTTITQGTF